MRYFLILLICCASFFAAAQDSLVHITPKAARHALAQGDSLEVYKLRDAEHTALLADCRAKDEVRKEQLTNMEVEARTYKDEAKTNLDEAVMWKNEVRILNREVRKQKVQKVFIAVGGAIIIVLILL